MDSQSGSTMDMPELLDENIFDILSKLSVKSLMRFKFVCKSWCSLISDPQFMKAHFSRLDQMSSKILLTTQPQASIMDDEDFENSIVELNYPIAVQTSTWFTFVGSCNGLVCLVLDSYTFILWNPSTGQFKQSPPSIPFDIYDPDDLSGRDIYDPDDLSGRQDHLYFYGFGYDPSIDNYKIVIGFWQKHSAANICCPIQYFNLKSNEWKFIGVYKVGYHFEPGSGIFLNGNLHWISDDHDGEPHVVLSFNIKDEKFMEVVPLPADCHTWSYQMRLSAFDNALFLCTIYKNAYGISKCGKRTLMLLRLRIIGENYILFDLNFWGRLLTMIYITRKHKLVLGVLRDTIRIYDLEAVTYKAFQWYNARFLNVIVYL